MSHHKSGKLRNYTDSRQFLTSAGDNGWIFHVSWVPVATAICHNVIKVAQVSTANTFNTKKITLSLTITIQHVIFMEWLHFTIHQFFKSAMQGISSLSSRWAIARASYCYVLILWRNLFQPFSIFDLQSLPIYLNPASVPGGSSKTRFARYYTLPGASKHVFPSRAARKPQEIPSMEPFLHHRQPVSPATTFILLLTASTSKCPPKIQLF